MVYKSNTGIGYSNSKKPVLPQVPIKEKTSEKSSNLVKIISELADNIKSLQKEIAQLKEKIDVLSKK